MLEDAVAQLSSWGLTPTDADRAGIFYTPDASQLYSEMPRRAGLVIPYWNPDGTLRLFQRHTTQLPLSRVRLLGQEPARATFTKRRPLRYLQPDHSPVAAYWWPGLDWTAICADTSVPLVITEGEAKAIRGCLAGFATVALGGVYSYGQNGDLLPDLDMVRWDQRDVFIVYDSDAATNTQVLAAEARLVELLHRERSARCRVVRLPPAGDAKVGLDDYLTAHGADALRDLMQASRTLTQLDGKCMALNRHIAWIEREAMVYDRRSRMFLKKDNLISGSHYSSIRHHSVTAKGNLTEVSVAQKWLTHPHAARYDEVLFRPGEPEVIKGDGGRVALNMWQGYDMEPGDVAPWLELTEHLFAETPPDTRDLPRLLLAYKAQNPMIKIPLGLVLVGPEGSGKSLWAKCVQAAYGIYGVSLTPANLIGEFRGWLESSLVVVVNEANGSDMAKAAETLRTLISDEDQPMNDKFRTARQVKSFASYIITANDRAVGSFRHEDRRMIVVGAPPPAPEGLYDRVGDWLQAGGARHLMHYLATVDIGDWRPPKRAPLSPEKYLAFRESLSPVQELAERMLSSDQDTIRMWLDSAVEWARVAEVSNTPALVQQARQTLDAVRHYQLRPWYQPEELAAMFPAIITSLTGQQYRGSAPTGLLSRQLRDAGIPYLRCADNPKGFWWRGRLCQFLVISEFDKWRVPIRQADFERL
ncbi:MAG: DUF3854 domain-containing protein, partial [Halothiobacillaceae bacterium]